MSESSSEEHLNDTYVFIRDRPEWKDVQPISQHDTRGTVAPIAYSDKFQDVHDYLRGVLKTGEMSERTLELTEIALDLNASNYTTWKYRRDIIKHLGCDVKSELEYTKRIIESNPKNYQVWHHCKVILEWIGEHSNILDFTERALKDDSKNYHAWQSRQWAVMYFKLFDEELHFVDNLLIEDVRNNSAWNHRYFVINNTTQFTESVVKNEISYTIEKIQLATNNESAWSYLRGVLVHNKEGMRDPQVMKLTEKLYASGCRSPQLLAFIADKTCEDCENIHLNSDLQKNIKICLQLYSDLANKYDKIRCNYWMYLYHDFSTRYLSHLKSEES